MAIAAADAAARAWLDRLPAAQRLAADAYTGERLQAWIIGGLVVVVVSIVFAKTDILGRMRRRLDRDGPRPWLTSAVGAGVFTAALMAAEAPFDALSRARADAILGRLVSLSPQEAFVANLYLALTGILPAAGIAVLLVPLLQAVMRARPRTWPWLVGSLLTALILAVGWAPYALSSGPTLAPLSAGPLRTSLTQLISDTRTPADQVYVSRDPAVDAEVTGGFGRAKVVMGPRLLDAPPAEVRAYVGHLMGHYAHGDVFSIYLIYGVLTLATLIAMQGGLVPLSRLIRAPEGAGPSDPEVLPILAILLIAAIGVATPASASFIRWVNVRADAYSLDHARSPDGLAAVLERDWDHESVSPPPLEEAVFYTHPPLYPRLVHAMAWKVAHSR